MKIGDIDFGKYPVLLAPMEDVTDPSFRLLCKEFGADMVYTEFISSDALIRSINRTRQKLTISKKERPVGKQHLLSLPRQREGYIFISPRQG